MFLKQENWASYSWAESSRTHIIRTVRDGHWKTSRDDRKFERGCAIARTIVAC